MKTLLFVGFCTTLFLTSCTHTSIGTPMNKPVAQPTASAENIAQGKMIYENNCGKCHTLPVVSKFSDEKWIGIMNWMAPKAKFTDTQKALAYLYVSNSN